MGRIPANRTRKLSFLEARHEVNIGENSKVMVKFGIARLEQELVGEKYVEDNGAISREMIYEYSYDEKRFYGEVDYLWEGWVQLSLPPPPL